MTVYAWPTSAAFKPEAMDWALMPNTRAFTSPFTQGVQVVDLLGERWKVNLTLPAQPWAAGDERAAFFSKLRGGAHQVQLWHFARSVPRGTLRGTPTVASSVAQGANQIPVTTRANATLRAGDMIGIGSQLFMVAADCQANGSGAITVPVCNRSRASIAAGAAITWDRPMATFRLSSDVVPIGYRPGFSDPLALEFVEHWT